MANKGSTVRRLDASQMFKLNTWLNQQAQANMLHGKTLPEVAEIATQQFDFEVSVSSIRTAREATNVEWESPRSKAKSEVSSEVVDGIVVLANRLSEVEKKLDMIAQVMLQLDQDLRIREGAKK